MLHAWLGGIVGGAFAFIGCIHLYWLFGGRSGFTISVPTRASSLEPLFRPRKLEIALVTLLFFAAAAFLLMRSEILPLLGPNWLHTVVSWSIAIVLLLRAIGEFRSIGFFKSIRSTPFGRMDTWVYSPLCLLLSGLSFWMLMLT